MSSSESPRDRLSRLRKRGLLSLDEYLREIELLDAEDNAAQARDETADRRSAASSANGRTGDSDEHLVDEDGMPYKPSPNRARHAAAGSGDEEDDGSFNGFDDDEPLDTTTGWWAECLGVGFVVGWRLIEGGKAAQCPV